jgi:hypothetical protein
MPKFSSTVTLDNYAPVADRIELFYRAHPEGRITTKLVSREAREIIVKCYVYRTAADTLPAATGYAAEREGDGEVNTVACLENTETSAVGRALANLGFTASKKRPSREEMEKAARARRNIALTSPTPPMSQHIPTDLMALLARAQRTGFGGERSRVIRESVARYRAGSLSAERLTRIESRVRHWLRRRSM